MQVGIHQPMYLPWLGLFDRIYRCDLFVLLDNVPYSKNYFLNRNKIKTANGWIWLTVPVAAKGKFGQLIKDVEIDNSTNWREKHWKSIFFNYQKASFFSRYAKSFEETYQREWSHLAAFSEELLRIVLKALGIGTPIVRASDMNVDGRKEELVLNICKRLNADRYLSGPDGKNYLNLQIWNENGVNVLFHNFLHPEYPQLYKGFIPQMSIIDLLFNCGDESLKILTQNQVIE